MEHEKTVFHSLEQIEKSIAEKMTVENIAREANFSKFHYSRLFRKIVGSGIMEYVTKRRLTLAGKALLETSAAIIDIALDFGFESREGFSRSFKAYMGVSPTEYRKYGLTAISQKAVKEKTEMTYSKTADEIIRELNEFIAKLKAVAEDARKAGENAALPQPFMEQFWNGIADKTDDFASKLKTVLQRVGVIAERPNMIFYKMDILKAIEETALITSAMAFHVGINVARSAPEYLSALEPLAEKYSELAHTFSVKADIITRFFSELADLIITDMKSAAAKKAEAAIQAGRSAAQSIKGYEYIKNELEILVNELAELPVSEITAERLDAFAARLFILRFSIETDILRSGNRDITMFEGIAEFAERLREAGEFFADVKIPEPTATESPERYGDIVLQGNILLFYTRGEIEKITFTPIIDDAQIEKLRQCSVAIDAFISSANERSDLREIADKINGAYVCFSEAAENLGIYGGTFRYIAQELKKLADTVTRIARK